MLLWLCIFIHDCIQTNKNCPIKPINISPPSPFHENATHYNYRISINTIGPISPSSQGNSHLFGFIDAFGHFVVTMLGPHYSSKYAIQTLLHLWITTFGTTPQYLVIDQSTEYINQEMAHLCTL